MKRIKAVRLPAIRSLTLKLTLVLLAVTLTGAVLLAVFTHQATQQAFNQYVLDQGQANFVTAAAGYYEQTGSWSGVVAYLRNQPRSVGTPSPAGGQQGQRLGGNRPPQPFLLVDASGHVLWPAGPYHTGDQVPQSELARGTPVLVNGKTVGVVLTTAAAPELDPREQQYLDRTNRAVLLAALGSTVVAVLLGFLLARTLTTPLRELTSAIRAMAGGRLSQAVPVRSHDELGELAATFNRMSAELARSNELRQQMTADIAHDLRTPLTVLTGYLESLRDGVLKPTPERLDVLYGEAQHLTRLVEDLRTLSLADSRELSITCHPTPPRALLERLAADYQQQAEQSGIDLRVEAAAGLPQVNVDETRMMQVLGNLVSNALRYTPSGGWIALGAQADDHHVTFTIQDNGTGMAPEVVPHVFERFYRGDESRAPGSGESGLGLAIAKSIVELHNGQINATSAGPGQGSTFTVRLPVAQDVRLLEEV